MKSGKERLPPAADDHGEPLVCASAPPIVTLMDKRQPLPADGIRKANSSELNRHPLFSKLLLSRFFGD